MYKFTKINYLNCWLFVLDFVKGEKGQSEINLKIIKKINKSLKCEDKQEKYA